MEEVHKMIKKRDEEDQEFHLTRMETAKFENENAKIQNQILLENLKKAKSSNGMILA